MPVASKQEEPRPLTPEDPDWPRRPIFMVGTVRSGSTLLANCLGEHPLIRYVGFELSGEWSLHGQAPLASGHIDDALCPSLGAEHASQAKRDALRKRFAKRLAEQGERPHFLNKNPHLSNKLGFVRALFPDASLIVTGRDLRSTVASTKRLFILTVTEDTGQQHYLPEDPEDACWSCLPPLPVGSTDPARTFPGGDVAVIAEYWLRTYEAIDAEFEKFERPILVRHRDLVEAPRDELARVVHELEIPERDFKPPVAIDPTRNRRWRQLLTEPEQESLEDFITAHRDRISALRSADITL